MDYGSAQLDDTELLLEEKSTDGWKLGRIKAFLQKREPEEIRFRLYSSYLKAKLLAIAVTLSKERCAAVLASYDAQIGGKIEDEYEKMIYTIVKRSTEAEAPGVFDRERDFIEKLAKIMKEGDTTAFLPLETKYFHESDGKAAKLREHNHFKVKEGFLEREHKRLTASEQIITMPSYAPRGETSTSGMRPFRAKPVMSPSLPLPSKKRKASLGAQKAETKTKVICVDEAIELDKRTDQIKFSQKMKYASIREESRKRKEKEMETLRQLRKQKKDAESKQRKEANVKKKIASSTPTPAQAPTRTSANLNVNTGEKMMTPNFANLSMPITDYKGQQQPNGMNGVPLVSNMSQFNGHFPYQMYYPPSVGDANARDSEMSRSRASRLHTLMNKLPLRPNFQHDGDANQEHYSQP